MADAYIEFINNLYKRKGIDLTGYKRPQMERRINSLMRMMNVNDYNAYLDLLDNNQEHFRKFVDTLTINVSEFYRNPAQWETLKKVVIPMLLENSGNTLNIWSAGCSTGEEPYTVAMLMDAEFPRVKANIRATDIDTDVLAKAQKGEYIDKSTVNLPAQYVTKYFDIEDKIYRVKNNIKNKVNFARHNLLRDPFGKDYDLILCRNVVIYFTEETKHQLYKNFHQALKMKGVLFTGSTEQIFQARDLGFELLQSFFYQKVK